MSGSQNQESQEQLCASPAAAPVAPSVSPLVSPLVLPAWQQGDTGCNRMFDENITVDELCGADTEDAQKIAMIIDMYKVGETRSVMWFDATSGTQNFITHDLNDRRHDLWDDELAQNMMTRGIVRGVSGDAWGQMSKGCTLPLRMMSWGSRCRGFYIAERTAPESEVIKHELSKGLLVSIFHDRMPRNIASLMINFHNTFHKGASISFLEVQATAVDLEGMWRAHCRETGQTVRGIGASKYEQTMMTFIMKHASGKLDNDEQFNSAKVFRHRVDQCFLPSGDSVCTEWHKL